jgi:hypothetical protein
VLFRLLYLVTVTLFGTVALCGVGAGKIVNRGWSDRHDEFVEGSPDP